LQIPFLPPAEYHLELVAERQSGGQLMLGIVAGGRQVLVCLDGGASGDATGLELVGEKSADNNETTVRTKVFSRAEPTLVEVVVGKSGIKVASAGRVLIDYSGDYRRLSVPSKWSVPHAGALFFGTWYGSFKISELRLTPGAPDLTEAEPLRETTAPAKDNRL
jgi:hypothetical protein